MRELVALVEHHGLALVFVNVLLEQAGLPLPAYPTLLVAAAMAAAIGVDPLAIVAVAVLAALVADLAWYAAGRRLGARAIALLCRVSLSPDACVHRTRVLFDRFGATTLLFAKFVPGVGLVATVLSGASRVTAGRFVLFDAFGALIWAGLAVGIGVALRGSIAEVVAAFSSLGAWALAIVGVVVVAHVARKAWSSAGRRRDAATVRRVSARDLAEAMRSGRAPVIIDVGGSPRADTIPGAVTVDAHRLEIVTDWLLRDCALVVACDCPHETRAVFVARRLIDRGFTNVAVLRGGLDAWAAELAAGDRTGFAEAA